MSARTQTDPWLAPSELGACACTQLRRTARKVSAFYDQALEAAGLTVTQYAVLVNVARAREISRTALAARLGMDRTTLTRNLIPLEKTQLVVAADGADKRERLIRLSPKGRRKLQQSYSLWADTQKQFADRIGPAALARFRSALSAAEAAA